MIPWQLDLLERLESLLPGALTPYGSVTDPETLDGWSDLDVLVDTTGTADLESLLGTTLWAHQVAVDGTAQVVRAVLEDGRRVDLTFREAPAILPAPAEDNAIRFEAALAAARFGRGSDLIGLHLTLGILREALVAPMIIADRETGTNHHRTSTPQDAQAAEVRDLLTGPLGPTTALESYRLHTRWQTALGKPSTDAAALEQLIDRGLSGAPRP